MKRALIVDDDDLVCTQLAKALGECVKNCTVVTAGNGRDALHIMDASHIDCIITDLSMPEMDGYEFLSYAKEHHPDVPVLVMTTLKSPDVEDRLSSMGIARCIEKPFNTKDLVPLILDEFSGILGEKSTRPELRQGQAE